VPGVERDDVIASLAPCASRRALRRGRLLSRADRCRGLVLAALLRAALTSPRPPDGARRGTRPRPPRTRPPTAKNAPPGRARLPPGARRPPPSSRRARGAISTSTGAAATSRSSSWTRTTA
jgi:hypothetical protein